ncbi:MAG: T9SS type A sorting domain-containing protein, partial [Bacteroidales bacterium]|nr:T9SS type A sorting domain-containing protein [Bacteroidales bacterium]
DTLMDVRLSVRSWAKLQHDLKFANDTTAAVTVTSKHTPATPVGVDQTIPYATLVSLNASQSQNRPLRWSKDSNSTPFYAPTNYLTSTTYSHPNLLFRDTTFYLSSISSTGCTSYFAPIHVFVNNPVPYDASVAQITEPLAKVYMDYDTVKVRIKNYGSQTLTSIPVTYTVHENNNGSLLQIVTETCSTTIAPQGEYVYKFNTLPNFPNLQNWSYTITAWTNLQGEMTRSNDTAMLTVTPINENNYCNNEPQDTIGLDISRVTFARMDNPLPPLGRKYVKLIDFNNPLMDPVELHRGMRDSIKITCENFEKLNDSTTKGFVTVYIDWDRDGVFETLGYEKVFSDSIVARKTISHLVTVPNSALLGPSRMRIILEQSATSASNPCSSNILQGEVQDYLINVTERPDTDVAIMSIVSPDDAIISNQAPQRSIVLRLSNLGKSVIDTINITYSFVNDTNVMRGTYQWTGALQPNAFTNVTLPAYTFLVGSTEFNAQVSTLGDNNADNNGINRVFHRFHVVTLIYADDFEASDMLFAPQGTNYYNQNLWQKGTPNKNAISGTTSGSTAWVTDTVSPIQVSGYGNKSYLYTPIINISQIKPDTIRFNLAANFATGSYMYMEYLNYLGKWVRFGNESDTLPWYTFPDGFNGSFNYTQVQYPLSRVSNDFSQEFQLRFVYLAKTKARSHDGCAIDDLEIGRAKRPVDAGVTSIILATSEPRFGQTISPRVMVKNFGTDTLRQINIAYHPEGSALPRIATWRGVLPPDHTLLYRFTNSPFVVQRTMPDTFSICAYTILEEDIYTSNDSICSSYGLIPLQNDAGLLSILSPNETVVAADSLPVTVRLKNFGGDTITSLPITFVFNNTYVVTETINFVALTGSALQPLESFNYTFNSKVRAPIGNSVLTVFTGLPNDGYLYNDSLTRHISTAVNLVDLKAAEIVLNQYDHNFVTVELAIDNLGARRAENFSVSYYYDNDTTTLVTETCQHVIPALSRGYHVFAAQIPQRSAPYSVVKAFINIQDDPNRSNDTTETFGSTFTDLEAVKVFVEENENPTCRVFLQVKNNGNLITTTPITLNATINGNSVTGTSNRNLYPGLYYNLEMSGQVPKNGGHQYSGTASVTIAYDNDHTNDQTSVVERSNYVGLPVATTDGLQLYQNTPNPFREFTGIGFTLPSDGDVRFFVINTLGEMVLQNSQFYTAGEHTITIDKGMLSAGTYFYGIEFEGQRLMRKMILQK